MVLFRTIWMFVNAIIATALIAILIVLTALLLKNQTLITGLLRLWGSWVIKAAGIKVKLHGLENVDPNMQYVILGNHESALDIFLVFSKIPLPFRIVAKAELRKIPLIGIAMEQGLFPLIDRKNRLSAIKALNGTFDKMKENQLSVLIFPEGTFSENGRLIPFKKGSFVLAIDNKLPILPVVMCGAGKINPPGTIWIKDSEIDMYFLPPIAASEVINANRTKLRDQVFRTMDDFQRERCC